MRLIFVPWLYLNVNVFFLKTRINIRSMSIQWSSLNVIHLFGQDINNCVKERIVNYQLLDDNKLASTFISYHLLSRRVHFLYKSILGGIDIWTLRILSKHDGIFIRLSYFISTQLILNLFFFQKSLTWNIELIFKYIETWA